MEEYKSNSHKSKEKAKAAAVEKMKVEKVVSGNVKVKKKSGTRKLADIFVSEDATNVKSYIFSDVIIPAAKKLIVDVVKDGIDMLLYGHTTKKTYSDGFRAGFVNYNKISDGRSISHSISDARARNTYSYDDIEFETRGEAEHVLSVMDDLLETYGEVPVAALYDLVGVAHKYTDNNYGWTDLSTARIERTRGGFYIKLPRVRPLVD